jgi:hypothetical protein
MVAHKVMGKIYSSYAKGDWAAKPSMRERGHLAERRSIGLDDFPLHPRWFPRKTPAPKLLTIL